MTNEQLILYCQTKVVGRFIDLHFNISHGKPYKETYFINQAFMDYNHDTSAFCCKLQYINIMDGQHLYEYIHTKRQVNRMRVYSSELAKELYL